MNKAKLDTDNIRLNLAEVRGLPVKANKIVVVD
jgi:hypothetical protein